MNVIRYCTSKVLLNARKQKSQRIGQTHPKIN